MLLGLNIKLPNRKSGGGYVPVPGNMFIVKDSAATEYIVRLAVRDGSGVDYTVPVSAKTSDGTEYYVPAYDPSLYLDYTSTFESVPGKQPGYYLVDDVSGNLTQTTFSSLITFSRASNATRFSPTGQLEYAPHNLLLQSQTFDNASWLQVNTSIAPDAVTAPDGTVTADTLIEDSATTIHLCYQNVTASRVVTISVFAKLGSGSRFLTIGVSNSTSNYGSATFNLSTGTSTQTQAAGSYSSASATITPAPQSFYRCTLTVTTDTVSLIRVGLNNTGTPTGSNRGFGNTYTGDGTSGVYIWGAQVALGPNALDYTPTTTAVVYGPRFDYDPATLAAKGLLIEEQRTNSLTYSEQFDNAAWSKTASSITANAIASPDGTLTGDKLVEDTATSAHTISQSLSATTQSYTISVYVKKAERKYFQLFGRRDATNYNGVMIDLDTGSLLPPTRPATTNNVSTTTATSVGNGWWRIAMTYSYTTTGTTVALFALTNDSQTYSYTGDGTSGIYIWGAQLEAGAFATSYIPTTTAATTRSADIASIDTLSPWYNSVEMTVYTEYDIIGKTTTSGFATEIDDGTLNNRIINIGQEIGVGDVKLGSFMNSGGSTSVNDYPITAMNVGSVYKLAFAVKSNDAATVANGISVLDATAVIPSGLTTLRLGRRITDRYLNGHLRRITYTPRRLTDAELQSLTS